MERGGAPDPTEPRDPGRCLRRWPRSRAPSTSSAARARPDHTRVARPNTAPAHKASRRPGRAPPRPAGAPARGPAGPPRPGGRAPARSGPCECGARRGADGTGARRQAVSALGNLAWNNAANKQMAAMPALSTVLSPHPAAPLPTVAPTRVPTVHSLPAYLEMPPPPPYCCPYPCPYCTLTPCLPGDEGRVRQGARRARRRARARARRARPSCGSRGSRPGSSTRLPTTTSIECNEQAEIKPSYTGQRGTLLSSASTCLAAKAACVSSSSAAPRGPPRAPASAVIPPSSYTRRAAS